jgi:hypothetical protein
MGLPLFQNASRFRKLIYFGTEVVFTKTEPIVILELTIGHL